MHILVAGSAYSSCTALMKAKAKLTVCGRRPSATWMSETRSRLVHVPLCARAIQGNTAGG